MVWLLKLFSLLRKLQITFRYSPSKLFSWSQTIACILDFCLAISLGLLEDVVACLFKNSWDNQEKSMFPLFRKKYRSKVGKSCLISIQLWLIIKPVLFLFGGLNILITTRTYYFSSLSLNRYLKLYAHNFFESQIITIWKVIYLYYDYINIFSGRNKCWRHREVKINIIVIIFF